MIHNVLLHNSTLSQSDVILSAAKQSESQRIMVSQTAHDLFVGKISSSKLPNGFNRFRQCERSEAF